MKKLWTGLMAILLGMMLTAGAAAEEETLMIPGETELIQARGETGMDAAENYILQRMNPGRVQPRKADRQGEKLEDESARVYEALREDVAAVAAGERTETIFSIPAENIYSKTEYTAQDLGVSSIVSGGVLTAEASKALTALQKKVDSQAVLSALMADCPYELYWYSKVEGSLVSQVSASATRTKLTLTGEVKVIMSVSADYAAAGKTKVKTGNETREMYLHVDPKYGRGVKTAAANARAISRRYEGLEDYSRLMAYKTEICMLASYNVAASRSEARGGNPWEMIWVFDGDPATKVVCEGYAKAFQFLNDLSASETTVVSVGGEMNGGLHMWNVVRMENGRNYLVDLTNCEEGAVGYPDQLFLRGYSEMDGDTIVIRTSGETCRYTASGDQRFSRERISISDSDYLAEPLDAPEFSAKDAEDWTLGKSLTFTLENAEQEYTEFQVIVSHTSLRGSLTTEVIDFSLAEDGTWSFGPEGFLAGNYRFRFAGKKGEVWSAWSEEIAAEPGYKKDLGCFSFTAATLSALESVHSGEEGRLAWTTAQEGLESIRVLLKRDGEEGTVWLDETFASGENSVEIDWWMCPGIYWLSLEPSVKAGYAYDAAEPVLIELGYDGQEWAVSGDGTLLKYFGPGSEAIVPETVHEIPVRTVGAGAFEKSEALTIRVEEPVETVEAGAFRNLSEGVEITLGSTVKVNAEALTGSPAVKVFGYTGSEAETAAKAAGAEFVSLGVKPETPHPRLSAEKGVSGLSVAVLLDVEADAVRVRETGDIYPCTEGVAVIPLTETGERTLTLGAMLEGVPGDDADPLTLQVTEEETGLWSTALVIPEGITEIERESFRGISATAVRIPETVRVIGPQAFADCKKLTLAEMEGMPKMDETAFEGCSSLMLIVPEPGLLFDREIPFLLRQETEDE